MDYDMEVLKAVDTIDKMVNNAPNLPLTGKIIIDCNELKACCEEIRNNLPEDLQQAKWILEEKDNILGEAREKYNKTITEANKLAKDMIEKDEITRRSIDYAKDTYKNADVYSKEMKLNTLDYVDKIFFETSSNIANMKEKYIEHITKNISSQFDDIEKSLKDNMNNLRDMAKDVKDTDLPYHDIKAIPDDEE